MVQGPFEGDQVITRGWLNGSSARYFLLKYRQTPKSNKQPYCSFINARVVRFHPSPPASRSTDATPRPIRSARPSPGIRTGAVCRACYGVNTSRSYKTAIIIGRIGSTDNPCSGCASWVRHPNARPMHSPYPLYAAKLSPGKVWINPGASGHAPLCKTKHEDCKQTVTIMLTP